MDLENFPQIYPLFLFEANLKGFYRTKGIFSSRHLLENFSDINLSDNFAQIYMAWDEENLYFKFVVETELIESSYPDFLRKDVVEIFIHTRADSLPRYMNKFSHHFLIFPAKVNGIHAMEITKFRTEDRHELCPLQLIEVKSEIEKKKYILEVQLSKLCLTGFDPESSQSIRLDFRIHRYQNDPMFFFFNSQFFSEHNLKMWPKIELVKE